MSTCDIITENGDKCVYETIFIKNNNKINCKRYCKLHFGKIILDLRKKFEIVYINYIAYDIININKTINGLSIDTLTDSEIINIFMNQYQVPINIIVELKLEPTNELINGWGKKLERWITSNWKIKENMVILDYSISFIGQPFEIPTNIICKNEYETEGQIGKGSYGIVEKVNNEILVKNTLFELDNIFLSENIKEICFLAQYNNKYITQLKCVQPPKNDNYWKVYIQNSGTSLHDCVSHPNYDKIMKNIQYVIFQMISAFKVFEENDIIHGDVKPSNICIDDNLKITVIDWGSVSLNSNFKTKSLRGTHIYMAPETNGTFISPINDIYSLGLTILYLYQQSDINIINYYDKISPLFIESIYDDDVLELVKKMVSPDYQYRYKASELYNDPIFKQFTDSVSNILTIKQLNQVDIQNLNKDREMFIEVIFEALKTINLLNCFILSCNLFDLCNSIITTDNDIHICICCMYLSIIMITDKHFNVKDLEIITDHKLNKLILPKVLTHLQFIIYKRTFDADFANVNYKLVYILMNDTSLINKTNDEYVNAYNLIINGKKRKIDKIEDVSKKIKTS